MFDDINKLTDAEKMDMMERFTHLPKELQENILENVSSLPKVNYYIPEAIALMCPMVEKLYQKMNQMGFRIGKYAYDENTFIPDFSGSACIGKLDMRFLSLKDGVGPHSDLFRKFVNREFSTGEDVKEFLEAIYEGKTIPVEYKLHCILPTVARIYDFLMTIRMNMSGIGRQAASVLEMDVQLYEQNLRICEDAFRHIRGSQSRPVDELADDLYHAETWLRHSMYGKDYEKTFSYIFIKEHIPAYEPKTINYDEKETFHLEVVKSPGKALFRDKSDWHNGASDFTDPGDWILMSDKQLNEMLCTYFDIDGIYKATAEHIPEGVLAMYLREHHMDVPIQPIYTKVGMRYIIHDKDKELLAFVIPGETCLYAVGYDQNQNVPIMMQFDGKRNMKYQFHY